MNLIERYGYDRAKRELALMDERSIAMISGSAEYREQVRAELLEHRRANNIYDVGDLVVCESFNGLVKVINNQGDRLVIDTGLQTAPNSKNTMVMALPSSIFRHATDKEIEQGHRGEAK